jgi:hypothetical protein
MNELRDPAVDGALEKWRARWPEWPIAELFVAPLHRERAQAWFALRHELRQAAWGGTDPRPGEAKLAWWAEELNGWKQGARRHPLGIVLQREPAPWHALAASLPTLLALRERVATTEEAANVLAPFADSVAGIAAILFRVGNPAPTDNVVNGVLAERVLEGADAGVPLEFVARAGEAPPPTAARLWAKSLLERWPAPHDGSAAGRVHASLLRERLRRFAAGGAPDAPLPAWRTLAISWKAARR